MADYGQQDYDRHRQMTVGYVFQDFNLLEGLTLKENIILPLTLQKLSETEIQQKYADIHCGVWMSVIVKIIIRSSHRVASSRGRQSAGQSLNPQS